MIQLIVGLLTAGFIFSHTPAWAIPAEIILIRHGEKPEVGNDLNDQGRLRAQQLIGFFTQDPRVLRFGVPVAIYAMKPSWEDMSNRPIETVTPLAASLDLKINSNYTKSEAGPLVNDILSQPAYDGKLVLICWAHTVLLDIVREIGVKTPPAPPKWPGRVFDWAMRVDLVQPTAVRGTLEILDFSLIHQNLPMDFIR